MVNDVNYIKDQFKSWHKANNWLIHVYPKKLSELEFELTKIKAIKYEEKVGGTSESESMRISKINDKMNELEFERKHNENICELCERQLMKIKKKYQSVFEYMFKYNSNISYVSYRTNYTEAHIYRIVDTETERLSRE